MSLEDKYLDEGLANNVKNAISDITSYMKDVKKFYPQLTQISDLASKNELEKASKLCQDMRLKANSSEFIDLVQDLESKFKVKDID